MLVTHDPHAAIFATHERHLEKGILSEADALNEVSTAAR